MLNYLERHNTRAVNNFPSLNPLYCEASLQTDALENDLPDA